VLDFSRLTRDQAAALVEVTVEHFMDGHGENAREVRRIRFKLASKIDALELLGKHHRLYVERHQHDVDTNIAERLERALARVDGPEQSENDDEVRPARDGPGPRKAAAPRAPRPADRRRRSPRARTVRPWQNIAGKVQKVAPF
jgi:hypothetical protein